MPFADLLPLALLGAVLGLDVVSFPQAMLSRPLVAATLAGAVAGDVRAGFLVGAVLELFALETLPIGASRYPEWGSAAAVGGALAALHAETPAAEGFAAGLSPAGIVPAGAVCVIVLASVATAWIGGVSMVGLRKLNGRLARRSLGQLAAGSSRAVVGLQLFGIGADLVRGFALTVAALLVLHPMVGFALREWSVDPRRSRAVVVGLAAAVAGGAVWKLFHAVPRARWLFAGGLAIGFAVLGLI